MKQAGSAPLIFNAANEIAVDAFLRNRIGFLDIPRIIETTLDNSNYITTNSVDDLLSLDAEIRQSAKIRVEQLG